MKFKDANYPVLVGTTHIPELNAIEVSDEGVAFGASVTISRLMEACSGLIASRPTHQTSTLRAVLEQSRWFAGPPIRNAAALGGNIATASPISDLNPIWMAAGAVFTVAGEGTGERQVAAESFFLGYRKVDLQPHEILYKVRDSAWNPGWDADVLCGRLAAVAGVAGWGWGGGGPGWASIVWMCSSTRSCTGCDGTKGSCCRWQVGMLGGGGGGSAVRGCMRGVGWGVCPPPLTCLPPPRPALPCPALPQRAGLCALQRALRVR